MPRIAPVEPPHDAELSARFARVISPPHPPLNLYRMVAQHPRLFSLRVDGGFLRRHGLAWLGTTDRSDRELLILRTTVPAGAVYEWQVYVPFSGKSSWLSAKQIAATTRTELECGLWTQRQWPILDLVDALLDAYTLNDRLWSELRRAFTDSEIIELVTVCGLYLTVSMLINACGVEPENDVSMFSKHGETL